MAEIASDERLLERASRGDEAAFTQLYRRHRDAVFRFAYRLLGARNLAEDVTQECFLSLIQRPAGFDPTRAALRTYLYAAVRNQALKHFRRERDHIALEDLLSEAPLAAGANGPLPRLLAEELTLEVQRAIAALPPLQREALILFEYEELSLAEIALVVGAEVGTVKARLFRAREGLRRALAPYLNSAAEAFATER